jgi:hypothetical protein
MSEYDALFNQIFGVKPRKLRAQDWRPTRRKNTSDTPSDFNRTVEDEDGRENPDRDDDEDDGTFHAGDGGDTGTRQFDDDEQQKRNKQMTKTLSAITKKYGIVALCKSVEDGKVSVSEHELCKLIEEAAERENTTCAKLIEEQSERGLVVRKAIIAARDAQFVSRTSKGDNSTPYFHAGDGGGVGPAGTPGRATLRPRVVGGADARNVNDPRTAIQQLEDLANAQRAQHPELSAAGAFAAVYMDVRNAELVRREREENRPVAVAWGA